jgi:hypothetical protein
MELERLHAHSRSILRGIEIHMQNTFNWWFLFYGDFSPFAARLCSRLYMWSEKDYHSIMNACVGALCVSRTHILREDEIFRLFCIRFT